LISKERATAIAIHFDEYGKEATCRKFSIPEETLNRYLRVYKKETTNDIKEDSSDILVRIAASKQKLADIKISDIPSNRA